MARGVAAEALDLAAGVAGPDGKAGALDRPFRSGIMTAASAPRRRRDNLLSRMISGKPRFHCMLVATLLPSSGAARAKTIANKTPMVARTSQSLRRG